jgi:hypothetical protein
MKHDDWNAKTAGGGEPGESLEAMLARLEIERAPASLTRRLMRIPREEGSDVPLWARWLPRRRASGWLLAPALAAVPLLVLSLLLLQPPRHSAEEIEQARRQLAVAFAYIDRAGFRAGDEIQTVLGEELRHSIKDPLSRHIPFTTQSHKEDST